MAEEQTKLTFDTGYDTHKNKNLSLIVTVMNAMKATVAVHRNTTQIRFVGPIFDRVDDGDGAVEADAQAVRLGAVDFRVAAAGEVELLEAALEEIPGGEAGFLGAALRLGLVGTEENVALDFSDA